MPSNAAECQQKHRKVIEYLDNHNLDIVVLTRRCNFAWFTGGGLNHVGLYAETGASSLIVTREKVVCVTNRIEAGRVADEELADLGITVRISEWYDASTAVPIWREALDGRRIAYDVKVSGLPDGAVPLKSDFDLFRWTLMPGEIERFRALCRDTAACLENACRKARRDMTEHQFAGQLAGALLERGIRAPALFIAADERISRYRHPIPTATRFKKYGMAVIGGERDGLIASCTRLFSFGPISSELRRKHDAVCRIDAALIGNTRPDKTLGDLFKIVQDGYAEHGFDDEWKQHHQGGPTGYTARDAKAFPGNKTKVLVHQAFAWNPTIAGTKSEDTILVGQNGNEILTCTGQWPTTSYPDGGRGWDRSNILPL